MSWAFVVGGVAVDCGEVRLVDNFVEFVAIMRGCGGVVVISTDAGFFCGCLGVCIVSSWGGEEESYVSVFAK